jgi:hypothetical protein
MLLGTLIAGDFTTPRPKDTNGNRIEEYEDGQIMIIRWSVGWLHSGPLTTTPPKLCDLWFGTTDNDAYSQELAGTFATKTDCDLILRHQGTTLLM